MAGAAALGQAEVQLFIIFPLISGTSWLFVLGIVLIIASFVLGFIFAASAASVEEPASAEPSRPGTVMTAKPRYGGVVIIGPVPIVFGSDKRMTLIMLVLAVVLTVVVLALALLSL